MTDYKQHCIKLLQILDTNWPLGLPTTWAKWADAVRADLAKPEPEGPTDEELADTYWTAWHEHLDRTNSVLHTVGLRAVLARWGNHPGSPDSSMQPS